MIAKNKKGKSFGGCVRYVLNEGHEILAAEGVLAEDAASIIRSFVIQRSGRPEIKHPVGHIPIAFSPEDSDKMTNEFLTQLAHEYMEEMGIRNTQSIIVRHHDTGHPHIHIVYNRIDNDLKVISVNNDYKRNIKTCKRLKDKYGLTYGTGKENVNRPKLTGVDKVKYQIHDEIAANLPKCTSYKDLEKRLRQAGITIRYKYRSGVKEQPENIQGISFEKSGIALKGSEIDRKFSHSNLKKAMKSNMDELLKAAMGWDDPAPARQVPVTPKQETPTAAPVQLATNTTTTPEPPRPVKRDPPIGGIELTPEQWNVLRTGGHIYLENMDMNDGKGKFSSYVFLNDEKNLVLSCNGDPDKMVEYGGVTIRLRDKVLIENGQITKAKMKWWGGIDYQYPFVWKDEKSGEVKHSFTDPRIPQNVRQKQRDEEQKQQGQSPKRPPARRVSPPPRRTTPPPKKNNGPKIK